MWNAYGTSSLQPPVNKANEVNIGLLILFAFSFSQQYLSGREVLNFDKAQYINIFPFIVSVFRELLKNILLDILFPPGSFIVLALTTVV